MMSRYRVTDQNGPYIGAVDEVHRILTAQPSEEAVPRVFGIQVRIADIDLVQRHRSGIAMRLGFEVDVARRGDVVHWALLSVPSGWDEYRQRSNAVDEVGIGSPRRSRDLDHRIALHDLFPQDA